VAKYVPGVPNRADKPSRTKTTRNDWTIEGDVLKEVCNRMCLRPPIDAFADDHNHHLPHYWTYFPSPHASGTNAMAQVWNRHQLLHKNTPWGMIPRIRAKLRNDKARALIVATRWPTMESMRLGAPYIIPGSLYKDRDGQLSQAPRLLTQVCLLDGSQMVDTSRR